MPIPNCISLSPKRQWCKHYLEFRFGNYHSHIIFYSRYVNIYACLIPIHIVFHIFKLYTSGITLYIFFCNLVSWYFHSLLCWWDSSMMMVFHCMKFHNLLGIRADTSIITWCKQGLMGRKVVRGDLSAPFLEVCLSLSAFGCTVRQVSCREFPPVRSSHPVTLAFC